MPGQLGDGVTATRDVSLTNSKAFCEGRQAKAWNESPNPHVAGSESYAAWSAGYTLAIASGVQGPCNITQGVTVPNLVGRTLAQATGDLLAVGLRLGTVTLTTGNVASQLPAAAAIVRPGSAVNVTLTSYDNTLPMPITWANASTFSTTEVNLIWEASTDNIAVTNYSIYMDGSLLITIGNILEYRVGGLSPNTTHTFYIRAKDAAGNLGGPSNTLTARTSVINVMDYGAVADGVTDNRAAFSSAIAAVPQYGQVYVPVGDYYFIPTLIVGEPTCINLKSNMTLLLNSNAIITMQPQNTSHYKMIRIDDIDNVNIIGGQLIGDRALHGPDVTGEWGHGIYVLGGVNVYIKDTHVSECWGDGFILGRGVTLLRQCNNIYFYNVVSDHNRRQGLSISHADGVIVNNSIFKNTRGTSPESGIDVEPDTGKLANNILIKGCTLDNNRRFGFLCLRPETSNVIFNNNTVSNTGVDSVNSDAIHLQQLSVGIEITNNILTGNYKHAISLSTYEVKNTLISGNSITAMAGVSDTMLGLWVDTMCNNNSLINNTLTGYVTNAWSNSPGIVNSGTDNTISGNTTGYTTTVPNIVGMTDANARSALTTAHLTPGIVTGAGSTVVTQTPSSGAIVEQGATVAFTN